MSVTKKRFFPLIFVLVFLAALTFSFVNFSKKTKVQKSDVKEELVTEDVYAYIKDNPKNIDEEERILEI